MCCAKMIKWWFILGLLFSKIPSDGLVHGSVLLKHSFQMAVSHKIHTGGFLWANHKDVNKPTSSHERIITLLFNYNYAKSVKRWFKHDFANEQQISCATDYHHRLGNLICKLLKTSAGQITAHGAVVCAVLWPCHAAPNPHTKKNQTNTNSKSVREAV